AQVLLAVVAGMYAVYHGPKGIRAIAERVHGLACALAHGLRKAGVKVTGDRFFDTLRVSGPAGEVAMWLDHAFARRINLRRIDATSVGVALDETTSVEDVAALLEIFGADGRTLEPAPAAIPDFAKRTTPYLQHPVFNSHHSETEMLRYMKQLERR